MARKKKPSGGRKIAAEKAGKIVRVFEKAGYERKGQTGAHLVLRHPKKAVNVVIPIHPTEELQPRFISGQLARAGIDREEYFRLLDDC